MAKCNDVVINKIRTNTITTRYPWCVVDSNQIIINIFNYKAEAKNFALLDKDNRTAFDASGVTFEPVCIP